MAEYTCAIVVPIHECIVDFSQELVGKTLHRGNGVFERQFEVLVKAFEFVLVGNRQRRRAAAQRGDHQMHASGNGEVEQACEPFDFVGLIERGVAYVCEALPLQCPVERLEHEHVA